MFVKLAYWINRITAPDVAQAMELDGTLERENYVMVDDRGADVTLFCFSGFAALFGGLPAFEFGKILSSADVECNRVFFRDIRRMAYAIRPDGEPGGVEFFEAEVKKQMEALGAKHNIALGRR